MFDILRNEFFALVLVATISLTAKDFWEGIKKKIAAMDSWEIILKISVYINY